mgnify:CR=1 FL=1
MKNPSSAVSMKKGSPDLPIRNITTYSKKYPAKTLIFALIGFFHIFILSFGIFSKPKINLAKPKKLSIKTYKLEKETKLISTNVSKPKKITKKISTQKKTSRARKKTKKVFTDYEKVTKEKESDRKLHSVFCV